MRFSLKNIYNAVLAQVEKGVDTDCYPFLCVQGSAHRHENRGDKSFSIFAFSAI